ncbi:MAG: hypothetical protein KAT57_05060 [Candidatus Lokiarchaeota archaeon]|nr:hypothetical protein [Candidatus Lokiarchaeota archaeon]
MITNDSLELNAQQNKKDFYYKVKNDCSPPPFIGCLISDKDGIRIASFEVYKGALEFFIKKNMKDKSRCECFDVELIPMYFCALERFSEEINIQNVPCINLKGTNIILHSIFDLNHFTVIFFLNPFVHIKSYENLIHIYFKELYEEYKSEFQDIKKLSSIDFKNHLEILGMEWIRHLNNMFLEKSM